LAALAETGVRRQRPRVRCLGRTRRLDVVRDETVYGPRKEDAIRATIEIQNWELRGPRRPLPGTLVDTGSEYTWIPRSVLEELRVVAQRKQAFVVADGRRIDRDIGYALVRVAGSEAPDLVVFAEPGDMTLLGAHSLEGLNLKIDPVRKELVPAGPVIAAAAFPWRIALARTRFPTEPLRNAHGSWTEAFPCGS